MSDPMSEQEREARAGEYVIGTLPADERTAFERDLQGDPALQAMVHAWEEGLAGLADLVPDEAPDPQVWAALERTLERMTRRDIANPAAPAPDYLSLAANAAALSRSRARWRATAAVMTAMAAALALFVASTIWRETSLQKTGLRDHGTSYLAVVNRGGDLPALVVQVDTASGVVHVRSVAAETPTGRSLELWYIAAAGGAPRSLGLVDRPTRDAAIPAVAQGGNLAGGTLAVSVEPQGGSTTGGPSGPVVYSGKLIQD